MNPATALVASIGAYVCAFLYRIIALKIRMGDIREDLFRLGSDFAFMAFALCITAAFNPGSFLYYHTPYEFGIIAALVTLLVYMGTHRVFISARNKTRKKGRATQMEPALLLRVGTSYILGILSFAGTLILQ